MCRSPQPNVDDKTIPESRKALEATSDSPFAQAFLNRRLSKCQATPENFAESTGTNTQHSDFCKFGYCWNEKLVT